MAQSGINILHSGAYKIIVSFWFSVDVEARHKASLLIKLYNISV